MTLSDQTTLCVEVITVHSSNEATLAFQQVIISKKAEQIYVKIHGLLNDFQFRFVVDMVRKFTLPHIIFNKTFSDFRVTRPKLTSALQSVQNNISSSITGCGGSENLQQSSEATIQPHSSPHRPAQLQILGGLCRRSCPSSMDISLCSVPFTDGATDEGTDGLRDEPIPKGPGTFPNDDSEGSFSCSFRDCWLSITPGSAGLIPVHRTYNMNTAKACKRTGQYF